MATTLPRTQGAHPHHCISSVNPEHGKGPNEEATKKTPDIRNEAAEGVPYYTPAQKPSAGTAVTPQADGRPVPKLFTPLLIRGLKMQNRIMVSPMCQYSSHEGFHTPWHVAHLGGIVQRGPGLTMVEATAVQARGRITPEDSGLWLDAHIGPLKQHVDFAHSQSQKIAIQLAHAGRKASTVAPWLSHGATASDAAGGWPEDVVGPSAIPYNEDFPHPREMTLAEIGELKRDFVAAAKRAVTAGFDVVELHAAHGYLLHSFLSPASNVRTDAYGGSFENRVRLTLEIVDALREEALPDHMPLFVRISATDWLDQGVEGYEGEEKSWTVGQSCRLATLLADRGVDLIDVSSGGNHPKQKITTGPGYQAPFAKAIKRAVGDKMLVATVGSITSGKKAQELLEGGKDADDEPLDVAAAGRMFLKNPGLVWTWAEEIGVGIYLANQIGWGFGGRATRAPKDH